MMAFNQVLQKKNDVAFAQRPLRPSFHWRAVWGDRL